MGVSRPIRGGAKGGGWYRFSGGNPNVGLDAFGSSWKPSMLEAAEKTQANGSFDRVPLEGNGTRRVYAKRGRPMFKEQ